MYDMLYATFLGKLLEMPHELHVRVQTGRVTHEYRLLTYG